MAPRGAIMKCYDVYNFFLFFLTRKDIFTHLMPKLPRSYNQQ